MSQQLRTTKQRSIVSQLVERFKIDGSKVLFLNSDNPEEPWLRAREMASIARQSGLFKVVRAEWEQYVEPLKQIIYQGTVVDLNDHIYSLPGVATIDEKMSKEAGDDFNANDLAESRALRSTLVLAGFDPFDPTSVLHLGEFKSSERDPAAAAAESRRADLARIHILAGQNGLIVEGAGPGGKDDDSGYREFLFAQYKVRTAAGFDALQRKSLIEALERYEVDEFADIKPERLVS